MAYTTNPYPQNARRRAVDRCVALQQQLKRCTPVIHAHLIKEGYTISLSNVDRTLRRERLTRKKRQATLY